MANEDKKNNGKGQEPENSGAKTEETKEGQPETGSKQEENKMKERKPWSTKKKVGVGGGIILSLIGLGCWVKKKFFSDGGDDEDED